MKILQISASYKPAYVYGGPIMSVSMLAEQLVRVGVNVAVYTTTADGKIELVVKKNTAVMVDGVKTFYFSRVTKDHTQFSPLLLMNLWKEAKNYDIIHIHSWWNLTSVLSCIIASWREIPVVVSPRGTLSSYSFSNKNKIAKTLIHKIITKPLLKRCYIHTTSKNEYIAVRKIISAKAFFEIPNFVRLNSSEKSCRLKSPRYFKIIFLSRIDEKKGLHLLLNALPFINAPFRLSVVGDGNVELIDHLKSIAKNNNTEQYVDWLGFKSEDKFDLLNEHDLFVLPSHDENFGNAVIESLSVGTAVLIGENVGVADYVANNNLGWLCHTDPVSIAEKINMILTLTDRIEQIKINAPKKILEDFDPINLVKKYIQMYQEIITAP